MTKKGREHTLKIVWWNKFKNEFFNKVEKNRNRAKKKLQRAQQIEEGRVLQDKTLKSNLKT